MSVTDSIDTLSVCRDTEVVNDTSIQLRDSGHAFNFNAMGVSTTSWHGRHHRDVTADLISAGWQVCGVGDWAVTLRSPHGDSAARVCPFDPAYEVFVRLCRRLPKNLFVPRVDNHVDLDGGAQLTIMEFLMPAEATKIAQVKSDWDAAPTGNTDLTELRAVAEELNTVAAREVPWWDGIDLNGGNIMTSDSGQVKIVDIFCLDGEMMYDALRRRPAELRRRVPADRRRHMADIGYIAKSCGTEEVAALRRAAAAVDALSHRI